MKAAVYRGVENITIEETEKPECASGEAIIRVKSCAVCGTDVRTYFHGKSNVKPPQILGHEIAGVIEETGPGVPDFTPGDRVAVAAIVSCGKCRYCGMGRRNLCENFTALGYEHPGGFALYVKIPAQMLTDGSLSRIPGHLSFDEAAIAEPFACAINGQELSRVSEGDTVVIIGAGPVGCMHAALASARKAGKIIMSDISGSRLKTAEMFGADIYLNPESEDLGSRVMQATGGRGADVTIIAAPSGKAQEEAVGFAAPCGRINFFGGLPKDNPFVKLDSNLIHYKELFVHGTSGSLPEHNRRAIEMFSAGSVDARKFISGSAPLEGLTGAIKKIASGEGLKIVINPD